MSRFAQVEQLLQSAVGPVFPSAQLVIADQGRVVLESAAGEASDETLFDIASLTKPLATVTLAMRLVEGGRLSLEEELRPGVSLRSCLCHASGLPGWKLLRPVTGASDDRAGLIEAARAEPLERAPGTRSVYSDLGFILLGDAVERAGGRRLDALFAEQIAGPLGLGISYGPIDPARAAPTEGQLRGVVHDENARAMGGVAPHAGLFSTARDVSRLTASLVASWADAKPSPAGGGFRLVAPDTLRSFWSPCQVPGSTWCLGWDRPSPVGSSAGTRWPRDGVGHLGYTGCSLWIDPPRARWVVLLSNRVHPTRDNERIKAFRPALHDGVVAALDG